MITILTNAAAMEAVYVGPDGLLLGSAAGKLFIDMSTVRGDSHRVGAPKVAAQGAVFLECPVSGTVGPARRGTLVGFAGGTPEVFARAKPLLEQVCRRVELIGPMGSGANMKLAANLLLAVFWQALAEAVSLVRSVDIDPVRLVDLLADSNLSAGILRARGAQVAAALAGQDTGAQTFARLHAQGHARHAARGGEPRLFPSGGRAHPSRRSTRHRQPASVRSTAPDIPPTGSITSV